MNTLKLALLLIISIVGIIPSSNASPSNSKIIGNVLFSTALAGSFVSFKFWLPATRQAIDQYGVAGAIATTHTRD